MHRNRLSSTSFHHVLDVGSVLVGLEAEGNYWNETEREPLPSFVDARAVVTAVLALCGDVLVAFEERGEGYT